MRAILEINGKQYEVEEGRYIKMDHLDKPENEEMVFDNVQMIVAGEQSLIGTPYVEGATVKAQVKRHARDSKVIVYKMRCKKGYRRKQGHRQDFTELQIIEVDFPGREKVAPKKADAASKPEKAEAKPKKSTTKAKTDKTGAGKAEEKAEKKAVKEKKAKAETKPAAKKKTTKKTEAKPKAEKKDAPAKKKAQEPEAKAEKPSKGKAEDKSEQGE